MTRVEIYQEYLRSEHWKLLRESALERDGWKCTHCGSCNGLEVHHDRYRERFCDTVLEDLKTLCAGCHERTHDIHLNPTLNAIGVRVLDGNPITCDERQFLVATLQSIDEHERARAKRLLELNMCKRQRSTRQEKPKEKRIPTRDDHLKQSRIDSLRKLYSGHRK